MDTFWKSCSIDPIKYVGRRRIRLFLDAVSKVGRINRSLYPWRKRPTAYGTFVAEFFLQRTGAVQAAVVYDDFIKKHPTLKVLLNRSPQSLRKSLKPLGLKKRADLFCEAVAVLKVKGVSRIPSKYESLLALPGVGPYTARAVQCFGFNQRRGLIDPNVIRIFERYFGLKSIKPRPRSDKLLWSFAEDLLQYAVYSPREINWGILDVGRDVCRKIDPKCDVCPLSKGCDHLN